MYKVYNSTIEREMIMFTFSREDVNINTARMAYNWISFDPDTRAKQEQDGYFEHMTSFVDETNKLVDSQEKGELAHSELQRYKEGYLLRLNKLLGAKSRCASSAITGGSGFNVRRAEKRNMIEHNRMTELIEYSKKAQSAILKKLREYGKPVVTPIEELKSSIASCEHKQEQMKACNKIIKSSKMTDEEKVSQMIAMKIPENIAKQLLLPDFAGRIGFADYELINNNANIKRMKERLARLEGNEAKATSEVVFEGGKIVDNAEADRVQIVYDDKPDADTIGKLKREGWRWSPSNMAWQRMRTNASMWSARRLAGIVK